MDDFVVRWGADVTPYFIVTDDGTETGNPVDLTNWSDAVWIGVSTADPTKIIQKEKTDMTLAYDPNATSPTIKNCIYVPLLAADTGGVPVGQYDHALEIVMNGLHYVVYPTITYSDSRWVVNSATFFIADNLAWDGSEIKLMRAGAKVAPRQQVRQQVPKMRGRKSGPKQPVRQGAVIQSSADPRKKMRGQ